MIKIKKPHEIEIMRKSGAILKEVLNTVLLHAAVGVSEKELDLLAEKLIREKAGKPGFMEVEGYKNTICVATNNVVVHGIPTDYKLKTGDIIGIDCGVYLDGFHTDMAETIRIREKLLKPKDKEDSIDRFLRIGKEALLNGIAQVKPGNRVGNISKAIQSKIENEGGYSVTRSLVGHGVGRELHEDPEVPGYLNTKIEKTPLLIPGMTIAVEVIYNMGGPEVVYSGMDGWTISTEDNSLSGLFERTVLITNSGHEIIT